MLFYPIPCNISATGAFLSHRSPIPEERLSPFKKNYYLYREEVKPPAGAANYIGNISGMPQKDFARHCRTIGAEYCYTV